jgi:ribosome-associated protein YbcJ (S4-like RNA binding protein)
MIISRDAQPVQEVELGAGRTTIGRHPQNDVVIAHQAVSARHAAVTSSIDGAFTLEDLDSSNGTFVNGRRISRAVLADGDKVTIANVQMQYVARGTVARAAPLASIEVLNGGSAGKTLPLLKPLTTLGSPGVLVVVISRQSDGYFLARVQGHAEAQVNGEAVGRVRRQLIDGDMLELTGTRMRFATQIV